MRERVQGDFDFCLGGKLSASECWRLICSVLLHPPVAIAKKFSAHINGIIAWLAFFLKRFSPSVLTHGLERDQYCDLGLLICPLLIWHAAKVSLGEHPEAQSPQR